MMRRNLLKLVAICTLICILAQSWVTEANDASQEQAERTKRQAVGVSSQASGPEASISINPRRNTSAGVVSSSALALATTSSGSSTMRADAIDSELSGYRQPSVSVEGLNARPSSGRRPAEAEPHFRKQSGRNPEKQFNRQQRPVRPATHRAEDEDYYEEEDCDYYPDRRYDRGPDMFARPMRHLSRLMGDMFEQMQGMASGDYNSFPTGSNVAMASSYSNTDGDSRISSIVNNNGRRRGIVSETRNGRTRTSRIGDYADEEE